MPTKWGQQVIDKAASPRQDPITIDGLPMDDFVANERQANEQGATYQYNDDGTPYDPNTKDGVTPQLFEGPPEENNLYPSRIRQEIANNYAWNKGHEDAALNSDLSTTEQRAATYKQDPSVQDELVEYLHSQYSNEHLNYGVLDNMQGLPPEEQLARIDQELNRLNARKLQSRQHLLIYMHRNGMGGLPAKVAEESWMSLSVPQLQALGDQMRSQQLEQLRYEVDLLAAPLGEGFTATAGLGEVIQQDFIPLYGAITRIKTAREFLPEDVEIGKFRGLLPGEMRQVDREWFANASHEERIAYIRDIGEKLVELRTGPHAKHFTRYGIIENLMGVFTEDLLEKDLPKDTLDRWMGNLDVLLEVVYSVGLIAKSGSTLNGLFRAGNASSVRQTARAAGNHATVAGLDNQIARVAESLDVAPAELAVVDLARPPGLRDNLEVLPDGVKEVIEQSDAIRVNVLSNTDDVTGQGLTVGDRANAIAKEIKELDWGDGVHVNHRMMTVEPFENQTGFRITAVVGKTPDKGWQSFDELTKELLDLDPNLEVFEIVRRSKSGTIEPLEISAEEFARFAAKGEVPAIVEQGLAPTSASSRLFGGRRLDTIGQEELVDALKGDLPPQDVSNIVKELDRRTLGIDKADPLRSLDGDEYFLRMQQDRYWHTLDKEGFNSESFLSTGLLPRGFVAPNGKFGDDIFGAFQRVYLKEQTVLRDFDSIYKPFTSLGPSDKIVVQNIFEWAEDFAKAQADRGLARAPTYEELITQFDGLTPKQIQGYAAIREGLDLQWELFNRRLYRDFHNRGLKTARAVDPQKPNYHGTPIPREKARAGTYYDPEANELKTLEKADVEDIYNGGGDIIELDFPIDAPNGGKFNRVLVRSGDYELGDVSKTPLNYYEGYHMRFYEDPVYIVKHTEGVKINGVASKETFTEATRTAGSSPEAAAYISRYARLNPETGRYVDFKDPRITWEVKPAKNINNTEGTLFQQQALQREGRLFWDKRNTERLPDVNGNRSKVQDLARGLEKGTAMAARQVTHEDLFTTMKTAFGKEFKDLISPQDIVTKDIKTIIAELRASKAATTTPSLRKRYNRAIELAQYLRIQMGTDSAVVPLLREATISVANWVANLGIRTDIKALKKFGGWAERRGQSLDPFRFARSVAFHTFMVFRPVRQLLLQSAQISYLSALDPAYIASGRVFKDSFALKRGIKKMTTANYADGWNDTHWAKSMGLSKKEYKRLVEEFHRSGLLETVDVHAFNATANRAKNTVLRDSTIGKAWYKFRGGTQQVKQVFQNGFDMGERNNVTFTYMLALRRAMANGNFESLTKMSRQDFDKVALDASNLALAMTRPNKFGYQSGATGMTFQFLSFSHKAALGMIGQNPALKGQGLKIALSTYMLFGSNMFGGEDWAREQLAKIGISRKASHEVIPGVFLSDLLAAGIIESGFNAILQATTEEQKRLDLSFLAPGANVTQIYEAMYEAASEAPEKGFLGPFHNPASGFLKGMEFIAQTLQHNERPPQEKFLKMGDALLRNVFPGLNDANRAALAYTMGEWRDKDGDKLPGRPVLTAILARGLLGVRTEEEMAYYRLKNAAWEDRENIDNAVDVAQTYIKELFTGWAGKKYGDEYIYEQMQVLNSMYETWPEGIRQEIFKRALTEGFEGEESPIQVLAKMQAQGGTNLDVIAPWIEMQEDMSLTEKQQLLDLTQEISRGYKQADKEFADFQREVGN